MTQTAYVASPYQQPVPGNYPSQILHGLDEELDYLPGTHIRVWFTHLRTAYPDHRHDCLEIIEGVHLYYTCRIGGVTYTISPGDILIIPPGTIHDLAPAEHCNGWIYLCDIHYLDGIPSAAPLQRALDRPLFISQKRQPNLYMLLTGHLSRMRNVYFSASAQRELLFDAELTLLLTRLIEARENSAPEEATLDKRHAHSALFTQVIDYIEQNYARDLTLDAVARHFNLSNAYFSRLFSQYVHESFSGYLTNRRLKEAERLLADNSLSITEVAIRCGYSSPASFSRTFQSQRKCTPSQFRQTCLVFSGRQLS